jgi:hypothetical protein
MTWRLAFEPLLAEPWLWALTALAAALALAGLAARARGAVLRSAALAATAFALWGPTLLAEEREPIADIAVIVLDESQSQTFADRQAVTGEAARRLAEAAARLPNLEIRTVTARSGVTEGEDGTRLFGALREALADVPPERYAGAVFITDGQVHDVPESGEPVPGYAGPLHALITGQRGETDRRVVVVQAPKFGIVGQAQTIRFKVEDHGIASGDPVEVTISIDGAPTGSLLVTPGETVETSVPVSHGGANLVEIVVAEAPGELTTQNNRAIASIKGIRDRLRVLLVSGEPHPGERTWRNLLKADASVDLVHFTILRPPEKQDGTPINELSLIAFPTRELFVDKLSEFDLIIFDRYQRRGVLPLAYIANIADYVEKGGAVLVNAGPDYASPFSLYNTPLAAVLPAAPDGDVTVEPFRPVVTERGERHPVTRGLPGAGRSAQEGMEARPPSWGRWFRIVDAEVKDGETVMAGPGDKPLMVLSRSGEGRVALLLSDHAWLWARGYEGGGPQAELLRRLAHWTMKEPELEEEALLGEQKGSDLVIERRTMAKEAGAVTVTAPSGKTGTVTLTEAAPGVYRGRLPVTEAGIYRLADGKLTSVAAAGSADPRETAAVHATDEILAPALAATGGAAQWLKDGGSVAVPRIAMVRPGRAMAGSGWIGFQSNGSYRVTAIERLPLFGSLLMLALLLGLASAMWWREGR